MGWSHVKQNPITLLIAGLAWLPFSTVAGASSYEDEGAYLSPAEQRGRDIWYKATAGNARHHMYVLPQRFKAPIDWYNIFGSQNRDTRFNDWGVITDPDCKPATSKSYGFDVCPGDEDLLKFVGKRGYRDPACDLYGEDTDKEDACELAFGTSTGVLGFRKFPNPRFESTKWQGWQAYDPMDGSVEPPFLFGISCGSCHIGFDPKNPPKDPEKPEWENIRGAIGNQYIHVQEIFLSQLDKTNLQWQALSHVRPGTTDTSAVPHDKINNPGTINAVINFDKRPTFSHDVTRWRRDKDTNSWNFGTETEEVFQILKGGEDSVGADLAIQRVYVNIGTCSEQCWINHLPQLFSLSGRTSYQTPFDINQCRQDCASWRVVEDNVDDLIQFLLHRRPTDLKDAVNENGKAVGAQHLANVVKEYDHQYANEGGVMEAGRKVFAKNCASCHSSQKPKLPGQPANERFFLSLDFLAKDENGIRIDWLGNDERTEVGIVGTNRCRSLHSNHKTGNIWEEFASETLRNDISPSVPELENEPTGGRGYYRNISLLSVWAHAPFMHNNAIGPEMCSQFLNKEWDCMERDPSVEGRLKLYEASMRALLYPESRQDKISVIDEDIGVKLPIAIPGIGSLAQIEVIIPKGTPMGLLGSLDIQAFANAQIDGLKSQLDAVRRPSKKIGIIANYLKNLFADKDALVQEMTLYSNCSDLVENKGHTFGAELSDQEKTALIQYMKNF